MRALTRVFRVPDWLEEADVPFQAIPVERRSSERPLSERVFWASATSGGLRAFGTELAFTLRDLRALRLFSALPAKGPGWVELRLVWSTDPSWATLLARDPFSELLQERYGELARSLAKLLDVPFETAGGADA